jgi:hydroxymethylpyrimidine/phosphomethylpyrimidine kinase
VSADGAEYGLVHAEGAVSGPLSDTVSSRLSFALLAVTKFNSLFRSAINIRNNGSIIEICENNFRCTSYSRSKEAEEIKKIEGSSVKWGIINAFRQKPDAEVVYHDGDFGKEPMVILFGQNPKDVLEKIRIVLQNYVNN